MCEGSFLDSLHAFSLVKNTSDTALKSLCEPQSTGYPRSPSNGDLIKILTKVGIKTTEPEVLEHKYLSGHCVCDRVQLNVSNIPCAYQVLCSTLCIETSLWHKRLQILWWQKAQGYHARATDTFQQLLYTFKSKCNGKVAKEENLKYIAFILNKAGFFLQDHDSSPISIDTF